MINATALYREVLNRIDTSTIRLESMKKFVNQMIEEVTGEVSDLPVQDVMFILTNQKKYGAAAILTETARQLIAEKLPDGKATILPSSIHELIIIPTTKDEDVEALKAMVMQINKTEISKEDILSNNIYHYNADTGKLEIAELTESEADEA